MRSEPLPVIGNGGAGGDTSTKGMRTAVVVVSGGNVGVVVGGGGTVVVVVSGGMVVVVSGGRVVAVDVVVCGNVVEVVVEVVVGGGSVVVVVDVVVSGGNVVVVVVVSGGGSVVVVVVGGTGTSTFAVAEMMLAGPPVTRRCAPCGSGPAGLPRYTAAGPGLDVLATTVIVPEATGIVARADPAVSVSTVVDESCPLISNVTLAPRTGCVPASTCTSIWPARSTVVEIVQVPAKRAASASSAIASAWMSSRPLAWATMSSDGTSAIAPFAARLVPASSWA